VLATSKPSLTVSRGTIAKISVKRQGHRGRIGLIGEGVGAGGGTIAGEIHGQRCPASGGAITAENTGIEALTPVGALVGAAIRGLKNTGQAESMCLQCATRKLSAFERHEIVAACKEHGGTVILCDARKLSAFERREIAAACKQYGGTVIMPT
jgi:hypothetical protein